MGFILALPSLPTPSDGGYAARQMAGLPGHLGNVRLKGLDERYRLFR